MRARAGAEPGCCTPPSGLRCTNASPRPSAGGYGSSWLDPKGAIAFEGVGRAAGIEVHGAIDRLLATPGR